MSDPISLFLAKQEFSSRRADIYEMIASNFNESGSRKVATLRELFLAWAKREDSRGNSIALVHRGIAKRLEAGMSLSQSLKPFIPREELLVIEAGEASGDLVKALLSVCKQKEMDKELKSLTRQAMGQPIANILTIAGTGYFCGKSLWPDMLRVVDIKFWPSWALPLMKAEMAFANNWQYIFSLFVIIIIYFWSIPRWTGRIRAIFDHMPPWSIYRDRQAANLLIVLGGLLKTGMELNAALARIERLASPWLRWRIRQIKSRLARSGSTPIAAFKTGLFSNSILDLIEDAARNRAFDESLVHLGSTAFDTIIKQVKVMVMASTMFMVFITGSVFAYQIAVQQIATNDATSKFMGANRK